MKKHIILFLIIFALPFCSIAQRNVFKSQKQDKHKQKFGFSFVGKKQNATKVPFEFHSNLIVVKLKIDNSDTLNFVLDTGISSILITDPKVAQKMGFKYVRSVKLSGAGDGEAIIAKVSVNHKIAIDDVVGLSQNVVVLENDILKLSEYMGIPIHGIFGYDLFNRFVVSLDFSTKSIYLEYPETFKFKKHYGEKYPIVITNSKPVTNAFALASSENKPDQNLRLVIDTGAAHALLLNNNEDFKFEMPSKVIRANLGRGLNGDINGSLGRINTLSLGKYELNNVIASFPDSLSFGIKFPDDQEIRNGSVGTELLRRFKVTFNYSDGYMALKPIKSKMNEEFEHDMSGMEVRAHGEKLNVFYVSNVYEDSPAYAAGIKENDEIIFMNDINVKELTTSDIYRMLSKKEGKKVELILRRNGNLIFTDFYLKRVI